jgi:hypothetical protein
MSWYEAGTVCGDNDQFLVTIQSPKELQYINYLLREQRYIDGRAGISDSKGSSYKAHIGEISFSYDNILITGLRCMLLNSVHL